MALRLRSERKTVDGKFFEATPKEEKKLASLLANPKCKKQLEKSQGGASLGLVFQIALALGAKTGAKNAVDLETLRLMVIVARKFDLQEMALIDYYTKLRDPGCYKACKLEDKASAYRAFDMPPDQHVVASCTCGQTLVVHAEYREAAKCFAESGQLMDAYGKNDKTGVFEPIIRFGSALDRHYEGELSDEELAGVFAKSCKALRKGARKKSFLYDEAIDTMCLAVGALRKVPFTIEFARLGRDMISYYAGLHEKEPGNPYHAINQNLTSAIVSISVYDEVGSVENRRKVFREAQKYLDVMETWKKRCPFDECTIDVTQMIKERLDALSES